ncbi:hypothetical protein Taro_029047, partial [Colocasia esculenta]|nr:hypothetical protein [Colocasia esculenta]
AGLRLSVASVAEHRVPIVCPAAQGLRRRPRAFEARPGPSPLKAIAVLPDDDPGQEGEGALVLTTCDEEEGANEVEEGAREGEWMPRGRREPGGFRGFGAGEGGNILGKCPQKPCETANSYLI